LKRNSQFARIQEKDVETFRKILKDAGATAVLTDKDEVASFNEVCN
jgi:tRNA G46 methylase TrmB